MHPGSDISFFSGKSPQSRWVLLFLELVSITCPPRNPLAPSRGQPWYGCSAVDCRSTPWAIERSCTWSIVHMKFHLIIPGVLGSVWLYNAELWHKALFIHSIKSFIHSYSTFILYHWYLISKCLIIQLIKITLQCVNKSIYIFNVTSRKHHWYRTHLSIDNTLIFRHCCPY